MLERHNLVVSQLTSVSTSLSLSSGALLSGMGSTVLSALIFYVRRPKKILWLIVFGLPFAIANLFYWLPAWLSGTDLAQYDAWAALCIGVWTLTGIGLSFAVSWLQKKGWLF